MVLDFEWTADKKRMQSISEITQFPSVLVSLKGSKSLIIDEFNSYVRPRLTPKLPDFSIELTGITQEMVDRAPYLEEVLESYQEWLRSHGLIDSEGRRAGKWTFCTWSDADIAGQLVKELHFKQLSIPKCFDQWLDLKVLYKRHYKIEPTGGLQACVESLSTSTGPPKGSERPV